MLNPSLLLYFTLLLLVPFVYSNESNPQLVTYNHQLRYFNHLGAEIAWGMSTHLDNFTKLLAANEDLIVQKNLWNNDWCLKLLSEEFKSLSDQRQVYLICRGPRFSSYQLSNVLAILGKLRNVYDTKRICLVDGKCYRMEPDLSNLMEVSTDEGLLRNAWTDWHRSIGTQLSQPYAELVKLMNLGARQAGHRDIGVCWRDEMETPNLKKGVIALYSQVKHLFSLIHALVRFKLGKYHGMDFKNGLIPAHLLGNMWGQRWDSLLDIVWPSPGIDRNHFIQQHIGPTARVADMVSFANKFYMDMGFPPLPPSFYKNSYFESNSTTTNCHGSAANMYGNGDYRVMLCASVQDSDLQTLIHEIGHIHYFMAYKHLPTIFQDGGNGGFHEAVGDAVTYGLNPDPSLRTLLQMALVKVPQIAFGLVVDLWRWRIFENEEDVQEWNSWWWDLNGEYMGIQVPQGYSTNGLDALGKYHIVDNIPYVRYFHASFLQHMFYSAMCNPHNYCNLTHRGGKLRRMLSRGSSSHWSLILDEFTGTKEVTAEPLLEYFKPLQEYLEIQIEKYSIPVGW